MQRELPTTILDPTTLTMGLQTTESCINRPEEVSLDPMHSNSSQPLLKVSSNRMRSIYKEVKSLNWGEF